jgi:hypothetical protein
MARSPYLLKLDQNLNPEERMAALGKDAIESGAVDPEQAMQTLIQQGTAALKSGQVTPQEAAANAKSLLGNNKLASPWAVQKEDTRVNAKLAESANNNASANMGQVMAQFSPPPAMARGSGRTQTNTGFLENTQGLENTMGTKDQSQVTSGTKNTQTDISQTTDMNAQRDALTKELMDKVSGNRFFTPSEINEQADTWRGMPEFQELGRGNRQLEDMIRMEAARPTVMNMAHPLALLTDAMYDQKTNVAGKVPAGQETQAERAKTIMGMYDKLQDNKRQQAESLRAAILAGKGGGSTITMQSLKEAQEIQKKREEIERSIREQAASEQIQDTHTDESSLKDTSQIKSGQKVEAKSEDPLIAAARASKVDPHRDMKWLQGKYMSEVKPMRDQLLASQQAATAMMLPGNAISDSAVMNFMARASGEKGPLSESDLARFAGSPAALESIQRVYGKIAKGERFTEKDRKDLMELTKTYEKFARDRLTTVENQYRTSIGPGVGVTTADVDKYVIGRQNSNAGVPIPDRAGVKASGPARKGAAPAAGTVRMVAPNGQTGTVDAKRKDEFIKKGYSVVQ